jgi:mRNA interferase MazF
MGQYLQGDVLLASVALDNRSGKKTRPVIVISTTEDGMVHVVPVSSKPPDDAPGTPLSIDDFATGGLDLFEVSYVMTSRVVILRRNEVIGKRGRLTAESLAEITGRVPGTLKPGSSGSPKGPRRRTC